MVDLAVIVALISGAIGLMLFIVGAVFSAIVAIGSDQKVFGWCIFLFLPLSLIFCAKNWEIASYSGRMVFSGTLLLSITAIIFKIGGLY